MYEMLYNGKLPIKLFSVEKKNTIPHISNDLKIFIVESGEYSFFSNINERRVSKGDVIVISCGQMHSFQRHTDTGIVKVLYVEVEKFKAICDLSVEFDMTHDESLIKDLMKSVELDDDLLILSKLSMVLRMVRSSMSYNCDSKAVDLVSKAMEYMLMNYKEKIRMTDVAEHVSTNPKQLMRSFKQVTDMTMLKYLTAVRINASLRELQLNKTILEVAMSNGFADSKSYHKSFKEYFNMTPKEYRKKIFGL